MRALYAAILFAFVGLFSSIPSSSVQAGVPTLGCTPPADDPEIAALARSLNYNLAQIYEYVYYNIEFVPTFGSRQGPLATLLSKRGSGVDQNVLLVSLLRQSCITANYRLGNANLVASEVANLFGVSNDVQTLIDTLTAGGIPHCVQAAAGTCATSGSGPAAAVQLTTLVTEATTSSGTSYLDPSLKSHEWLPTSDLSTAMGYNRSNLLSSALGGSSTVPGVPASIKSVRNVNQTNVRNALNAYADTFANHLRTNAPASSAREIYGGGKITSTNFGASLAAAASWTLYTTLPAALETAFTVAVSDNIDGSSPTVTFNLFASQIAGRRLTLTYSGSNQPILKLDGAILATGPATAATRQYIAMDVMLPLTIVPLGASISGVIPGSSNYYVIAIGASGTGRDHLSRHQKRVSELVAAGASATSEDVITASLAAVGASWIAQSGDARKFAAQAARITYSPHAIRGVVGKTSAGVYVDFRTSAFAIKTAPIVPDANIQSCLNTMSMLSSSLESTVVQQMQKNEAVSTVRLFKHFNAGSTGFLEASDATWATVKPLLTNWSTADLDAIEASLDGEPDRRVVLPQNGSKTVNSWTGAAWYLLSPDLAGAMISGGVKGGYGSLPSFDAVSPFSQTASSQFGYPSVHLSDPVNMQSGSYRYDHEDLVVGAGAFPFALPFKRSYESVNFNGKTELGRGWHHNYASTALIDSDTFEALGERNPLTAVSLATVVTVIADLMPSPSEPIGNSITASLAADWLMDQLVDNAVMISADGQTKKFIKIPTAAGTGVYIPPPGDASELTVAAGNVITVTDKHKTVLTFDGDGKISSWKDSNNNTVSFTYTGSGPTKLLATVGNGMGRTLSLSYNGSQQLTTVSDGSRAVTYTYDGYGNLATYTDPAPTPKTTNFSYGLPGLLTEIKYPSFPSASFVTNEYDSFGRIKKQTDALGNVWHYLFAGEFRSEEIDPLNGSKTLYHDGKGNLIRTIDPTNVITDMKYDGQGRRITTINTSFGDELRQTFDAKHNVLTSTHLPRAGGVDPTTGLVFDPRVQSWTYDATFNKILTATDARGNTTTQAYDTKGNLLSVTQPIVYNGVANAAPLTSYTYNGRGQPLTKTDPDNRITTLTYDPTYAHVLTKKEATGTLNLLTTYGYNTAGDVVSVTDPKGNTATTAYDTRRLASSTTAPSPFSGTQTIFAYDADGRLTSTSRATGVVGTPWETSTLTYNQAGLPVVATAPDGASVTTAYDALRRVSTRTGSSGRQELTEYDAASRIIKITDQTSGPLDPSITVNLGPVIREQRTYDAGKLWLVTDGKGNSLEHRYDGFQRLTNIVYPGHSPTTPKYETFGYDKNDNLRVTQRLSGATIWNVYDALNRRTVKQPSGQANVEYLYHYSGLLRAAKYTGSTAHHQFLYDGAARLYGDHSPFFGTQVATLDGNGNIASLASPSTAPNSTTSYTFDQLNRFTAVIDGPVATGVRVGAYTYNTLSQRNGIDYGPSSTVVASTGVSWTPGGRVASLSHTWNGSSLALTYTYNQEGQRSGVTASDASFLPSGLAPSTLTYSTNNLNQYTAISGNPVAYDANGNLTSYDGWTFGYNTEGQLITASKAGTSVLYEYDPIGRRNWKSVNGTWTAWASFGHREIHEYIDPPSAPLTWSRRFLYGVGLDEPIAAISGAGTRAYQLQDALGSTIGVLDSLGSMTEKYAYNSFGRPLVSGTPSAAYLFTGRRFDVETGLHYYRARYYSTGLGRFLQMDPNGTADGLNVYAYVHNDPLNAVDPFGLDTQYFGSLGGTFALGVVGFGGGVSAGISVPDRTSDIFGYKFILSPQVQTMGGLGAYIGIGATVGWSKTDGPPPLLSGSPIWYAEGDLGAGPSITLSTQGTFHPGRSPNPFDPPSGGSFSPYPKFGFGAGAWLGGGLGGSGTIAVGLPNFTSTTNSPK